MDISESRSAAIKAGLARARRRGRFGGPPLVVSDDAIQAVRHLPTVEAAAKVGLSKSRYIARRNAIERREDELEEAAERKRRSAKAPAPTA